MMKKKKPLAFWIFVGLLLGILAGIALQGNPEFAVHYIQPFGTIFLNLVKFIVVPIVLFSIMAGVISMKDIRKVGSIGVKTVVYYMCTTAGAVTIGLVLANIAKRFFKLLSTSGLEYTPSANSVDLFQTIMDIFPSNALSPLVNGNVLQVIVIALFFGFGVISISPEKAKPFADFVNSANEVSMAIMNIVLKLSPVGVFCLMTPVVAQNGAGVLSNLAIVLIVAYIGYLLHMLIVYSGAVRLLAGMNPIDFFRGVMPSMLLAFSSASSVATIPLNLECTEKLGAKREVASFVLPLGATINMDGTAIYQGVCTIFIAACYGINLTLGQQLTVILTATLASIGTAGVPGAGMIMLAMVLQSVGLPVDGIALVAGIDRIFDMGRTVVNITGDASAAVIVSKMEDKKTARKAERV